MKYRVLAKTYLFVKGSQADVTREDAIWLTEGEKKKFTDKQCDRINTIVADLVEKAQDKLVSQGVDFDKLLKHMPMAPVATSVSHSTGLAPKDDDDED